MDSNLTGRPLLRLLGLAVGGWFVGALILIAWLFASAGDDAGLAVVSFPLIGWALGYPLGAALLLLYGGYGLWKRHWPWQVPAGALLLYGLPLLCYPLLHHLARLVPLSTSHSGWADMAVALSYPGFALLYLLGLGLAFGFRDRPLRSVMAAAQAPPLLGGALLIAAFALRVTQAPEYRLADAVSFELERAVWGERQLIVEGRLTLTEAAPFVYVPKAFGLTEGGPQPDRVEWEGEAPPSSPGEYRVRFVWAPAQTSPEFGRSEFELAVAQALADEPVPAPVEVMRFDLAPVLSTEDPRLWPREQDGRWGFVNKIGRWVVEPTFDELDRFREGLARFKQGGLYGFVSARGEVAIPARYDYALPFRDGLAPVSRGGRWGYVDRFGVEVVPPRFAAARMFSEGLGAVEVEGQYGYVDRNGETVIPARFHSAHPFSEGLARVEVEVGRRPIHGGSNWYVIRKWGYIDRRGEFVVPPRYDSAEDFRAGRARAYLDGRRVELGPDGRER